MRPAALLSVMLVLLGCSSDQSIRDNLISGICDFERSRPQVLTSYVNNAGGVVYGDVTSIAQAGYSSIASVLAVTKREWVDSHPRRGVDFICQPVWGYFGPTM